MNLVAMIGIINDIEKQKDTTKLILKVEKPFLDSEKSKEIYDNIDVLIDNLLFRENLKFLTLGTLIGLKGRINVDDKNYKIIVERIQIF